MNGSRELDFQISALLGYPVLGRACVANVEGDWLVYKFLSEDDDDNEDVCLVGCRCAEIDVLPDKPDAKIYGHYVACLTVVPYYSVDIGSVWQVVEALRAKGLHLLLNDTLTQYRARFYTIKDTSSIQALQDGLYFEFADTAPLAICRAALKAIGKDVTN